jgi:hypothetical protein
MTSRPPFCELDHPSLRFGSAPHFIRQWGHSSANTLILTEPEFPLEKTLGPFQPLELKAHYLPINPRLTPQVLGAVVRIAEMIKFPPQRLTRSLDPEPGCPGSAC